MPPVLESYEGEPVSSELRPLLESVYREVYREPLNLRLLIDAIRSVLAFLSSTVGRTNANCNGTFYFFCFDDHWERRDDRWQHLPPGIQEVLEEMGGALHDTVSCPWIAERLSATPEQILERLGEIESRLLPA